jgi:Ser/Thr protein kinase RdoA (MazF antagonist)
MTEYAEQAAALERAYDIGGVQRIRELSGGMFLKPLLVEAASGRSVLRAHRFRSTARAFRFQAETVNGAARAGVRCPRIMQRRDGRWGVRRNGAYWALHEYAEGQTLAWTEWVRIKEDRPAVLEQLGATVAAMHSTLACLRPGGAPSLADRLPPIRFHRLRACHDCWRRDTEALAGHTACACAATRRALLDPRIAEAWRLLMVSKSPITSIPRQIVHGDISPVNLVWTDLAARPAFIDWDCVHVGLRMYDALGDVLLRAPADQPWQHRFEPDEVRTYLRGYAAAADPPVSAHENACIPVFLLARQLEDLRQRLAVCPILPEERDGEYAALVEMRLRLIADLKPYVTGEKGPYPWI